MENAQRLIVSVLLEHVFSLGLISQFTYSRAQDLVHSVMAFPELLRYPVRLAEEECRHECAEDSK